MRVVESKNIANEVFPDQDSNVEENQLILRCCKIRRKRKRERKTNDPVLEQQAVAAVTARFNNDQKYPQELPVG